MFKISNEKARGELIQSPKCQPVLQHFGRGNSGKTRWGYLLYDLQIACVNAIIPQSSASAKTQRPKSPRCWTRTGSLALRTSGLRGERLAAPQPLHLTKKPISQRPLLNRARAVLLGFSSETNFGSYYPCLYVCKQAAHPTYSLLQYLSGGSPEMYNPWSYFPPEVSRTSPPEWQSELKQTIHRNA